MQRCGIERRDGVVRIGVLCARCSHLALAKLVDEERRFWARSYIGPELCEACQESDEAMEMRS